jgi:hypothetical protein
MYKWEVCSFRCSCQDQALEPPLLLLLLLVPLLLMRPLPVLMLWMSGFHLFQMQQ